MGHVVYNGMGECIPHEPEPEPERTMDELNLTTVSPNIVGEALSMNQQAALDLARKLETEAAKLKQFTAPRSALEGAAQRLRDYIAYTL